MLNFLNNISPLEWILIGVVLVLFFGAKTMTRLGKSGGETLKEIKNIKKTFTEAVGDDDEPKKSDKGVSK